MIDDLIAARNARPPPRSGEGRKTIFSPPRFGERPGRGSSGDLSPIAIVIQCSICSALPPDADRRRLAKNPHIHLLLWLPPDQSGRVPERLHVRYEKNRPAVIFQCPGRIHEPRRDRVVQVLRATLIACRTAGC